MCAISLLVLRVSLGFDCISSWSMPIQKVYQFVCVLLSVLVLRVGLVFDCISSWSTPILLTFSCLSFFCLFVCFKHIRKLNGPVYCII